MANNEIRTGKLTTGEFTVTYQENGYGAVIPVIDGVPHQELMMGFVSETDREAGMKLIAEALRATAGDIRAAMYYMYNAAKTAANNIKADEAVTINGMEVIIDYQNRKAYLDVEEITNLDDINCELPREAVKAILVERATREIEKRVAEFDELDDDYFDEDEEYFD